MSITCQNSLSQNFLSCTLLGRHYHDLYIDSVIIQFEVKDLSTLCGNLTVQNATGRQQRHSEEIPLIAHALTSIIADRVIELNKRVVQKLRRQVFVFLIGGQKEI